jgi:hypothetical protein
VSGKGVLAIGFPVTLVDDLTVWTVNLKINYIYKCKFKTNKNIRETGK